MNEQFIKLSDGSDGLRCGLKIEASSTDDNVIRFIASDESLDRSGEIIEANGWDVNGFQKNPVFVNSHNYGDIVHILGRAKSVAVTGGKLMIDVLFAVKENPIAKLAYDLYKGGYLNAVSVGFIPKEWTDGDGKQYWRKFTKQELLEVSAVSVPCNPNALAMGIKSGAINPDDVKAASKLLFEQAQREMDKKIYAEIQNRLRAVADCFRRG
jgi:uncharacterized protein